MGERAGRPDQVLRSTVRLTGWASGRRSDVAEVVERVIGAPVELEEASLPIVVLDGAPADDAEAARVRLVAVGADVVVEEVWIERGRARDQRSRPTCPACGSSHTQPFAHAGPAARVNMKCTDCGNLFREIRR